VPGCDKNMPGSVIAMARLNRPSLMVYGGTIRAGFALGKPRDIISAFQSYGEYWPGPITDEQRWTSSATLPGAGACGGMYTANTMAVAIEALGLSLPYSSSLPAKTRARLTSAARRCRAARCARARPEAARHPHPQGVRERADDDHGRGRIDQRRAASARDRQAARVPLELADFQRASDRVPLLADLKPSGSTYRKDLHAVGGTPAVMKYLLERGFLHGDCMTVTGQTLAENLATAAPSGRAGDHPDVESPVLPRGHIRILTAICAGRFGRQDHRQGRRALRRHGEGLRLGRSHAGRARTEARSPRATSW
jgi:dihydroxy-acid dehydratase